MIDQAGDQAMKPKKKTKPLLKLCRNFRGESMWQCVGKCATKRHALIGRGITPAGAYADWVEACEFPF